jgi:hypothetical protein
MRNTKQNNRVIAMEQKSKFDLVFYDDRANYLASKQDALRLPHLDEYIVFSRESPLASKVTGVVVSVNKQYDYTTEDEAVRVTVKVINVE